MSELLDQWRRYLRQERHLAPATVKLYTRYVESLSHEVGDPVTLDTDDLRGWIQSKRGSAGSVGNRISALKSFYSFLVRTGARTADPSVALIAPKHRPSPGKPVEDLDEVLKKLDEVDRKANNSGAVTRRVGESRDMAIFLAETGLRISDAVACDWPVPCPSETTIRVGRRKEKLKISDAARGAWDRIGGNWPLGARATQRRFEKAGFNPHQLRHWHRAFKRPVRGAGPETSISRNQRPEEMSALQEVVAGYSDTERAIISDFLSRALKAVQAERS